MSTRTESTNITQGNSIASTEKFAVTESAAQRLNELLKKEAQGALFRISVNGGGCSGFQYNFDFVTETNADDNIFIKNGASVVIDEISLGFVTGSQLDYVETLGQAGFEIKNPLATATCGCGNSFAV